MDEEEEEAEAGLEAGALTFLMVTESARAAKKASFWADAVEEDIREKRRGAGLGLKESSVLERREERGARREERRGEGRRWEGEKRERERDSRLRKRAIKVFRKGLAFQKGQWEIFLCYFRTRLIRRSSWRGGKIFFFGDDGLSRVSLSPRSSPLPRSLSLSLSSQTSIPSQRCYYKSEPSLLLPIYVPPSSTRV